MNFGQHIASITVLHEDRLFALHYVGDDSDILVKLFRQWNDPEYLTNLFVEKEEFLTSGFYNEDEIAGAVGLTIKEAAELRKELKKHTDAGTLSELFEPLSAGYTKYGVLQMEKGKGPTKKLWLRLYAIRLEDGAYVITGGAIKLTRTMDEDEDLIQQKILLEKARDYLKSEKVEDGEQVMSIILEQE